MDLSLKKQRRGFVSEEKKNIRHILSETLNYKTYGSILMDKVLKFQFGESYRKLYEVLQRELPIILYRNNLILIDKSVEGLLLDIFITVYRNKSKFTLELKNNKEYPKVFNKIVIEIEELLTKNDISISERDKDFLCECLLTKRVLYERCIKIEGRIEAVKLTEEFLRMVDLEYKSYYSSNLKLKKMLSVHIDKMLYRLEQGVFEHNDIVENIKALYKEETRMVTILQKLILRKYGYNLRDEEVGFIILYLGVFTQKKIKAIVISDIGESVATSMIKQINNYCGNKIEIIGSYSLNYIRQFPIEVDVIFTPIRLFDIKLSNKTKIIYVNYLLQEECIRRIQEFIVNYDNGGLNEN